VTSAVDWVWSLVRSSRTRPAEVRAAPRRPAPHDERSEPGLGSGVRFNGTVHAMVSSRARVSRTILRHAVSPDGTVDGCGRVVVYGSRIDDSAWTLGDGPDVSLVAPKVDLQLGLESFCRGIFPRLIGALSLRVGGRDVAEDLAQETLSRIIERWDRVASMDDPEGYAFRTAFNLANSRWRRLLTERRALERSGPPTQEPVDRDTGPHESVRMALMRLTGRQREVVVYRFYLDYSVRRTAAAMDCAEGTVRALTAQAIGALRTAGLEVRDV
jgi:RNA polymerase sigma factor (sigma-70 family)